MARRLLVEIVGDSSSLERAFSRSRRSASGFSRDIDRAGRGVIAGSGLFRTFGRSVAFASSAFLGGAGFIAVTKSAVNAASDLHEQISKTNVVFGGSAASIEVWSKTSTTAFGLSQRQALATASSFGALLTPIGIIGRDAADQSRRLTELGADLASFYNTDVQRALDAIRSGLVGESEPLRQYAVRLSEARVQQEALRETGKRHAKQLTDQEKTLARIAIIYRDSSQAQGDFARTAGGLANQLRILRGNIDDLTTWVGNRLTPRVGTAVKAINQFFESLRRGGRATSAAGIGAQLGDAISRGLSGLTERVSDAVAGVNWARVGERFAEGIGTALRSINWPKVFAGTLVAALYALNALASAITGFILGIVEQVALTVRDVIVGAIEASVRLALKVIEPFTHISGPAGAPFRALKDALQVTIAGLERVAEIGGRRVATKFQTGLQTPAAGPGRITGPDIIPPPRAAAVPRGATAAQRNRWFDDRVSRMLDQVQDVRTLRGQVAALRRVATLIRQRIAATKDITRRLTLGDQLRGVMRAIGEDQKQMVENAKRVAAEARQRRKELADAMIDALQLDVDRAGATATLRDDLVALRRLQAALNRRVRSEGHVLELEQQLFSVQQRITEVLKQQAEERAAATAARQFRTLGLGPGGEPLVPGVQGLRRRLARLTDAISGTFLDTRKTRSVLATIRRVLSGGLGAVGRDVRQKIAEMLAGIDRQLKEHAGRATRFRPIDTNRFIRSLGLDLTPAQIRRLRGGLAALGPGATLPPQQSAAFALAGGVVINGPVHVYGVTDPKSLEHQLTKRERARPRVRRGAR